MAPKAPIFKRDRQVDVQHKGLYGCNKRRRRAIGPAIDQQCARADARAARSSLRLRTSTAAPAPRPRATIALCSTIGIAKVESVFYNVVSPFCAESSVERSCTRITVSHHRCCRLQRCAVLFMRDSINVSI